MAFTFNGGNAMASPTKFSPSRASQAKRGKRLNVLAAMFSNDERFGLSGVNPSIFRGNGGPDSIIPENYFDGGALVLPPPD